MSPLNSLTSPESFIFIHTSDNFRSSCQEVQSNRFPDLDHMVPGRKNSKRRWKLFSTNFLKHSNFLLAWSLSHVYYHCNVRSFCLVKEVHGPLLFVCFPNNVVFSIRNNPQFLQNFSRPSILPIISFQKIFKSTLHSSVVLNKVNKRPKFIHQQPKLFPAGFTPTFFTSWTFTSLLTLRQCFLKELNLQQLFPRKKFQFLRIASLGQDNGRFEETETTRRSDAKWRALLNFLKL